MEITESKTIELKTQFEDDLTEGSVPFSNYPRPQMKREEWYCLNGQWALSVKNGVKVEDLGHIVVPFPPESHISGIGRVTLPGDTLIYNRTFTLPESFSKDTVILHFGAVDQYTKVFVNGKVIGENTGGYLPFSFDITDALAEGENSLIVEVVDPTDQELPFGKQRINRGGIWYTPTSGIWQTVWIECVPKNYITGMRITPSIDRIRIEVEGGENEKEIAVQTPNGEIVHKFSGSECEIVLRSPKMWTPEDPYLYYFTITSGEDTVQSYFALRTVSIECINGTSVICLNGKPYFFHGLLDQGYFSDGIYTPASERGYENDILQMKACGFNMLRKHIKKEPEIFYYLCDKLGMAVFQDMVSSGQYSCRRDADLAKKLNRRGWAVKSTARQREEFLRNSDGIQKDLYNHPCIVCYTIFNEGWGQFSADACYKKIKAADTTRVYDATSGWFLKKLSDMDSYHIYRDAIKLNSSPKDKALFLSEFGGYSHSVKDHTFSPKDEFGYLEFKEIAEFRKAILALYDEQVIPMIKIGLSATVLTQVSDVEDEINGLLTYDRAVLKVNPAEMKKLSVRIFNAFDERWK